MVEVIEITTETNFSIFCFIFIVFYLYPRIPPFCAEIMAKDINTVSQFVAFMLLCAVLPYDQFNYITCFYILLIIVIEM